MSNWFIISNNYVNCRPPHVLSCETLCLLAGDDSSDYRQQLQLRRVLWDNALTFVRRRGAASDAHLAEQLASPAE